MHFFHVNVTFDLSTPKPYYIYPKVIPYTKFEHFGIIRFLSYALDISVKNALIDPVTMTLDLLTPK